MTRRASIILYAVPVIMGAATVATAIDHAFAPPVTERSYIVRVTYTHDLAINPYRDPIRCEPTRKFTYNELPEMDGYRKAVECVEVGR